jgi:secondary thiamine-phosphate synthase enzyme
MQKNQVLWDQKLFTISKSRGCHLVTSEILKNVPEIKNYKTGIFHLFLKHTSASICLNENYDKDVQLDMEDSLNRIVPENNKLYRHTIEGSDDMPAHVKSALIGTSLTIPIRDGKLELGTWQGIWLLEHRDGMNTRTLVATLNGISN